MKRSNAWKDSEIEALRTSYPRGIAVTIQDIPKRTREAIYSKAKELKLQGLGREYRFKNLPSTWKDHELVVLKAKYPELGARGLVGVIPNRTWLQIRRKAGHLGLRMSRPWYGVKGKHLIGRLYRRNGLSQEKVARQLGTSRETISRIMSENAIPTRTISEYNRKRWRDPVYRSKMFNLWVAKPNGLERQIMGVITKNNLPFRFVGDRKFWIGKCNPDFVHKNPKVRLCIEVANVFHHKWNYSSSRRKKLQRHGWSAIILTTKTSRIRESRFVRLVNSGMRRFEERLKLP